MRRVKPGERVRVNCRINGKPLSGFTESRTLLADFLRHELHLYGTHVGCEHGVCGACTILWNGRSVRSCIMLAVQADGSELKTIEGVSNDGALHPIQKAFIEEHGLQCGFCTPGFVMSVSELLEHSPDPTDDEIKDYLGGQICRCTGYRPILAGFARFAKDAPAAAYSDETLRGGPVGAGGRAAGCAGGCGDSCDGCDAVAVAGASV